LVLDLRDRVPSGEQELMEQTLQALGFDKGSHRRRRSGRAPEARNGERGWRCASVAE
jgi:hypothetical protein